jgi:lipoprotein signal peptidase
VVLLLVASTVGCDVVTKRLAAENLAGFPAQSFLGDTLRLSYAENAGGFLNFGATLPAWARTTVFTIAVGAFLFVMWRPRGAVGGDGGTRSRFRCFWLGILQLGR